MYETTHLRFVYGREIGNIFHGLCLDGMYQYMYQMIYEDK